MSTRESFGRASAASLCLLNLWEGIFKIFEHMQYWGLFGYSLLYCQWFHLSSVQRNIFFFFFLNFPLKVLSYYWGTVNRTLLEECLFQVSPWAFRRDNGTKFVNYHFPGWMGELWQSTLVEKLSAPNVPLQGQGIWAPGMIQTRKVFISVEKTVWFIIRRNYLIIKEDWRLMAWGGQCPAIRGLLGKCSVSVEWQGKKRD